MYYLPAADPQDPENWARARWLEEREFERQKNAVNHGYVLAKGGTLN